MIGIVIVAHGGLAREYHAALEHVVGQQSGIQSIAIYTGDDRSTKQQEICDAAEAVDAGGGVIIVADIFGASPFNLSKLACAPSNRRIMYGMNLPMLIKLAKSRTLSVSDAVSRATDAGRKYIDSQKISLD